MTIYSAIYSGVQVFESRIKNVDLMRRLKDNWINATQILKIADIEKPQRTKILEREIQVAQHEKVQGGYGKYQGTWIPFERAVQLAKDFNVYHLTRELMEHIPGEYQVQQKRSMSLVPASRPQKKKKTAAAPKDTTSNPKYHNLKRNNAPVYHQAIPQPKDYRDLMIKSLLESSHGTPPFLMKLPVDLDLTMGLDAQGHSVLHWASSLARIDIVKHLIMLSNQRNINLIHHVNVFGQTSLMRAIMYADNFEEKRFPELLSLFKETLFSIDYMNRTVLHHIALVSADEGKQSACCYYLKCILELDLQGKDKLLDFVDMDGQTALQVCFSKKSNNLAKMLINSGAISPSVHSYNFDQPADPHSLAYLENLNASYSNQISLSLMEAKELKARLDTLQGSAQEYLDRFERMKSIGQDLEKLKKNEKDLKSALKSLKIEMFDLDIKNYVKKHPNLDIPNDNPHLHKYSQHYMKAKQNPIYLQEMEQDLPNLKSYVDNQVFPEAMLDAWVDTVAETHKDDIIQNGTQLFI